VLFRRRPVWLPTVWGSLLLLSMAAVALVTLALSANALLAIDEPYLGPDGQRARVLVVEGWLEQAQLDQAIRALRRGHYERVVTSGGPITSQWESTQWPSYADRAAAYLREHGVTSVPVTAVPAPASAQDRTFLSAVMVREWAQREGVSLNPVDVYTLGVHARRSRMLYRMALGDGAHVGVLAARPSEHDPERWWTSSAGAKSVVMEGVSVVWTACCFWPPPPGTEAERWGAGY